MRIAARTRLSATKGVTVINNPTPRNPSVVAMVMSGVRCIDVRREGDTFSAALHIRQGEWLSLTNSVDEDTAFAAVESFVEKVAAVPQHYSAENAAAERRIAAEVAVAFTVPVSLPLAA
jgi:hypothetical protein